MTVRLVRNQGENVGHIRCPNPECKAWSAIRRQVKNGLLYGVCRFCGPMMWRTARGQEFFLNHGKIWGAEGPPSHLPEWIREDYRPWEESAEKRLVPLRVYGPEPVMDQLEIKKVELVPVVAVPKSNVVPIKKPASKSWLDGGLFDGKK